MQIRTFRAASLQDALEEIRQQVGPDAAVLHTRQVRDGWMGWLGRTYVEVTVEVGQNAAESDTGEADSGIHEIAVREIPVDHASNEISPEQKADARNVASSVPSIDIATNRITANQPNDRGTDQVLNIIRANPSCDLPPQLQAYRDELINIGVESETINRWMNATTSFAANLGDAGAEPWLEHLQRSVARELRFGGPIRIPPGTRHVVALVGPTGVGKTTTIAKLAAGFRLDSKRRVGLLTIDTYRIAAVQQLKAYAEIMDLPMQVVERPSQMREALETLGDVDLVLIDTAGRSPRSDARIDQLVDLLRSAQPDETHLVLSATSSTSAIHTVLNGFAPARPTAAIMTKLDEAPHTAGILSAITKSDTCAGIPVSYLTNGQQVPDDISLASAEVLLKRLLPARAAIPHIDAA